MIKNLLNKEFACMFLKETDLEISKKFNIFHKPVENMTNEEIFNAINYRNMVLILELESGYSVVFSQIMFDKPFNLLQKKYKDQPSYYFMANESVACFKILQDGKITRKVSSYGWIRDNTTSCEEQTLGKPSQFEIAHNKIYKLQYHRRNIDLSKKDILDMIEYYIGLDNLNNSKIVKKQFLYEDFASDQRYSIDCFDNFEFKQACIHIGGDSQSEYTLPFVSFWNNEWFEFSTAIERQKIKELNMKKILGINIFNKNKSIKIKSNNIYETDLLDLSNFCVSLRLAIVEAHLDKKMYKDEICKFIFRMGTGGEFIPSKINTFYLQSEFVNGKLKISCYLNMKQGKEQEQKLVFEINELSKENLIIAYNRLCDKLFNENMTDGFICVI